MAELPLTMIRIWNVKRTGWADVPPQGRRHTMMMRHPALVQWQVERRPNRFPTMTRQHPAVVHLPRSRPLHPSPLPRSRVSSDRKPGNNQKRPAVPSMSSGITPDLESKIALAVTYVTVHLAPR